MSCGTFPLIVEKTNGYLEHVLLICLPILRDFSCEKLQGSIYSRAPVKINCAPVKIKCTWWTGKIERNFCHLTLLSLKIKNPASAPQRTGVLPGFSFLAQVLKKVIGAIRHCIPRSIALQERDIIQLDLGCSYTFHSFLWPKKKE